MRTQLCSDYSTILYSSVLSQSPFTQPTAKVGLMQRKMAHRNNYNSTTRCCDTLDSLEKNFKFLQPVEPSDQSGNQFYHDYTGESRLLNDQGMEVLRGGIVRAMAAWEALFVDLLREAFNKLIDSAENLEDMKKKWGKAKKKKGEKTEPFRIKVALDEALKRRCDDNKESLSVLETLSSEDDWRELLKKYHADPILEEDFRPVFRGKKSIDSAVSKLFLVEDRISDLAIHKAFQPKVDFYVQPNQFKLPVAPRVEVQRHGMIYCSLLYYGFRCVLAHGIPNKTLESGALKYFDAKLRRNAGIAKLDVEHFWENESIKKAFGVEDSRSEQELKKTDHSKYKQAEMLLILRKNIENFASGAHISYQTWRNMCSYLKESAMWLDKAINELIIKL